MGCAMRQQTREGALVYWQGRQWAVTSYGIESLRTPNRVRISKRRLGHVAHDMSSYVIVTDVLARQWLDVSDFWEAWEQSCLWHNESFSEVPLMRRNGLARRTREAIHSRLADLALSNMAMSPLRPNQNIRRDTSKGRLRRIDG